MGFLLLLFIMSAMHTSKIPCTSPNDLNRIRLFFLVLASDGSSFGNGRMRDKQKKERFDESKTLVPKIMAGSETIKPMIQSVGGHHDGRAF
jgi:hypothetical protein